MKRKNGIIKVTVILGLVLVPGAWGTIVLTEVDPGGGRIEVWNAGEERVDVNDYQVCALFRYARLGSLTVEKGSLEMDPGEILVVTGFALTGETDLGLYRTASFGDPESLVDFVQWGSGGNGREAVAVQKGIWEEGDFLSDPQEGETFVRTIDRTGKDAWERSDGGSLGEVNDPGILTGHAFFGNYPWVYSQEEGWLFLLPTDDGLWILNFGEGTWQLKGS